MFLNIYGSRATTEISKMACETFKLFGKIYDPVCQ